MAKRLYFFAVADNHNYVEAKFMLDIVHLYIRIGTSS